MGLAIQDGADIRRSWSKAADEVLVEVESNGSLVGQSGLGQAGAPRPPSGNGAAPPFVDCHQEVAVAVAGEVRVHTRIRGDLVRRGHVFRSSSRAEAVAHLAEELWVPPLHLTLARTVRRLDGHFSVAAITVREPGRLVCTSYGVPVLLTQVDGGVLVVSGPTARLPGRRSVSLRVGEIAVVDAGGFDVLAPDAMGRVARIPWAGAGAESAATAGRAGVPGSASRRP